MFNVSRCLSTQQPSLHIRCHHKTAAIPGPSVTTIASPVIPFEKGEGIQARMTRVRHSSAGFTTPDQVAGELTYPESRRR